jgi:hypothetical protein
MDILKLNPEAFREAAQRIAYEQNSGCCFAIAAIKTTIPLGDYLEFLELFAPGHDRPYWWAKKDREPRIIALLLCADILESEQKAQRKRKP